MPVTKANRFNFQDQQTNIAVADLMDNNSSLLFNSPNNDVTDIDTDMEGFIRNILQGDKTDTTSPVAKATTGIGVERVTKSLSGGLSDLSKLNTKSVDNAIADMLPDHPAIQSTFRQLSTQCKNSALGYPGFGKPFDINASCGGGSQSQGGSCNSAQFGNMLNKLSNGQYNSAFNDWNTITNNIVNLANYGYNMNMCGALGILTSTGLGNLALGNNNVIDRSAAIVMGTMAASGNVLGFMDVSKSSTGPIKPVLQNPSAISTMFDNYNTPKGTKEKDYSSFTDRFFGANSMFDGNWNIGSNENTLSTAKITKANSDLDTIMKAKTMDNIPDITDLDLVFNDDVSFMRSSLAFN